MPTLTKLYSMKEAAQHNSKDDCWVVIDGKVYDVSSYMDEHPGGDNVLLAATGKDATGEFEDVGHSKNAREHMENFFIGELDTFTPHIEEEEEESTGQSKRRTEIVEKLKQHWVVPVAVVGISVVVTFFYLHRRK